MIYKYIYYKFYYWAKKWFDPFAPQLTSTFLITLLPISNLYVILYLLNYFGMYQFQGSYINSSTTVIIITVFVSLLVFNQLYFFWINKWREIIILFENKNVSNKVNLIVNIYIIFSISSYILVYLFDSLKI